MSDSQEQTQFYVRHRHSDLGGDRTSTLHPRPISESSPKQQISKTSNGSATSDHALPTSVLKRKSSAPVIVRGIINDERAQFFESQSMSSDIVAKMVSDPKPLAYRTQQLQASASRERRSSSVAVKTPQNSATLQSSTMRFDFEIIDPFTAFFRDSLVEKQYRIWMLDQRAGPYDINNSIAVCAVTAFLISELSYRWNDTLYIPGWDLFSIIYVVLSPIMLFYVDRKIKMEKLRCACRYLIYLINLELPCIIHFVIASPQTTLLNWNLFVLATAILHLSDSSADFFGYAISYILIIIQYAFLAAYVSRSDTTQYTSLAPAILLLIGGSIYCLTNRWYQEVKTKMDFHSRYARHNLAIQLFDQLKRINKGKEVSDLDFASPVEKAMELLRTLIGNSQMYPKDSQKTLEKIMVLLQNPHINVPDLSEQVRKTTALDDDHKAWIGEITSSISQMTSQPRRAAQLSDRSQAESSDVGVHNAEILSLLTTVDQWDFDLFRFDALVNQRPLSALAEHLFMKFDLYDSLDIPRDRFHRFVRSIEEGYHNTNSYHNALHAADVLHAVSFMISCESVAKHRTAFDTLCVFVGAIVHDHDHPGVTNGFLVKTHDPLAILYNDKSPLEHHHAASSFRKLYMPQNNFISHFTPENAKAFRDVVVDVVLATDLSHTTKQRVSCEWAWYDARTGNKVS